MPLASPPPPSSSSPPLGRDAGPQADNTSASAMHPLIDADATRIARDMPRAFRARDAHRIARAAAIEHDHVVRLALLLVASTASANVQPPCKGCLLDVP